jgi:hypothetical protein
VHGGTGLGPGAGGVMASFLTLVASPWFKYSAMGAAVLALIVGGILYHRSIYDAGKHDGKAEIVNDVQRKTIETLDAARISKERTDEEVYRTPFDDRVDGLR